MNRQQLHQNLDWKYRFFSSFVAIVVAVSIGALFTSQVALGQESQLLGNPSDENSVSGAVQETGLGSRNVQDIVQAGINIFLSVLSLIAVVLIIYGGYTWMTAGGNADKVTNAKEILKAAMIGLFIILAAWAITLFVIRLATDATNENTSSDEVYEPYYY